MVNALAARLSRWAFGVTMTASSPDSRSAKWRIGWFASTVCARDQPPIVRRCDAYLEHDAIIKVPQRYPPILVHNKELERVGRVVRDGEDGRVREPRERLHEGPRGHAVHADRVRRHAKETPKRLGQ